MVFSKPANENILGGILLQIQAFVHHARWPQMERS
jgi:hypothetical protein